MRSRLSLVIAGLLYAERTENCCGDGYQQFTHNLMLCFSMVIRALSVYTVSSASASLSMS